MRAIALGAVTVTVAAMGIAVLAHAQQSVPEWKSRAIEASQGPIRTIDGKEVQIRYGEGPYRGVRENWADYRTHAYDDQRPAPPVTRGTMPTDVTGDPEKGRALFTSRAKGPCTACHVIRDDFWPMGNIGTDLSMYGHLGRDPQQIYQMIYDIRAFFPESIMPPWGVIGRYTPEEIVHIVAFLQEQKGGPVERADRNIDPNTRHVSEGFGDNLDPTNNPGVMIVEAADRLWQKPGPNGQSCASCHSGGLAAMEGVATRWPRYVEEYGRVMSIDDFLGPHGEDTMGGNVYPPQSEDNIHLTGLIKMQSNGMPVALDLENPQIQAALERGEQTFRKRVGQRNHACIDCHVAGPNKGGGKFLGGRKLGLAEAPLTHHFPTYRTNFTRLWDIRKRFQWCMLPLGMNFIPGDSVEYAELELYLTSLGQGEPLSVPGMGH